MSDALKGMTQAKWSSLSPREQAALRSDAGLTPALLGHEGWRVEVTRSSGAKERFIVGRSTGWIPCHIELKLRTSTGGPAAWSDIVDVRRLYKVRDVHSRYA